MAHDFMRRAATRVVGGHAIRGLKPTATITMSLRDKEKNQKAAKRAKRIQRNFERLDV